MTPGKATPTAMASPPQGKARERLAQIEASTEWQALVDAALASPPNPEPLFYALLAWSNEFRAAFGGPPLEADFPLAVDGFFRRIAFCNLPEPFHRFVDGFVAEHARRPSTDELPDDLRCLADMLGRPMRRPRCDTKPLRDAARAWRDFSKLYLFEANREMYAFLGRLEGVRVTDFTREDFATNKPSELAVAKLARALNIGEHHVRDRLKAAREDRRLRRKNDNRE